jgi:hypothetical protein
MFNFYYFTCNETCVEDNLFVKMYPKPKLPKQIHRWVGLLYWQAISPERLKEKQTFMVKSHSFSFSKIYNGLNPILNFFIFPEARRYIVESLHATHFYHPSVLLFYFILIIVKIRENNVGLLFFSPQSFCSAILFRSIFSSLLGPSRRTPTAVQLQRHKNSLFKYY